MKLSEYKKQNDLTLDKIAEDTEIARSVIHRACTLKGYIIKLKHAIVIVDYTKGAVDYKDLIDTEGAL